MEFTWMLSVLILVMCSRLHVTSSDNVLEALRRAPRVKRLIGGMTIEGQDWPWLVHLHGKVATDFFWGIPYKWTNMYCGGTVLNSRWILTAAHCFRIVGSPSRSEWPKYWHVRAGETDNSPSFGDRLKALFGGRQLYNIHADQIHIHPRYDQHNSWKHDIALIRLRSSLPLTGQNPRIRPAVLPPPEVDNWPADDEECVMKGWGCTRNGRGITEHAQVARMPKMSDEACMSRFGRLDLSTRLCAGYNNQGIGICAGDSGGPLVCRREGSWYLAGVASFTAAENPGQYPGVFTKVAEYVNWIKRTM